MKTQYICERCGQTFENYDDAYKCENSHHMLAIGDFRPEIEESAVFTNGNPIPTKITISSEEFSEWDEDAGEWKYHYVFGEYKLVKILPEKDCEKFIRAKAEREEKFRRELEEYMARREAEKKAKEEAESEAI